MSSQAKKLRVLIFIVAYNAEATLKSVLKRIPAALTAYDTEVLVIDDASADRTFEEGYEFQLGSDDFAFPLTVLFNPENQGYGGNQKLGYHYAIKNNFDIVALVHGDGQYAPEKLPTLLQPLIDQEADAVFGSRMVTAFGALKGGMPLYKYVGNRILTTFQNVLLGTRLSEFHSGYRLYSVDALKKIPFHLNTSEFHFDTQIIIQLLLAKFRVRELPIPTYYGDEISYVNGIKYAWDVVVSTALAVMQRTNLQYRRWLDVAPDESANQRYESKVTFDSTHSEIIRLVEKGSRVLDIGAGPGHIAGALRKRSCHVTGIDAYRPRFPENFDRFIIADLDSISLKEHLDDRSYDYILLLDVIEHLKEPEKFLYSLHESFKNKPEVRLIVTTGNVAFLIVRIMLLLGQFNYGKKGILDLTHKRLFTFASFRRILEESGFRVVTVKGVPVPWQLVFGQGLVSRVLGWANRQLIKLTRGIFSYQIMIVVEVLPSLEFLLKTAVVSSAARVRSKSASITE